MADDKKKDSPPKPEERPSQPLPEQRLGDTPVAPWEMPTPEEKTKAHPVREALKKALREVISPEKAEEVIDQIEAQAGTRSAEDVKREQRDTDGKRPDVADAAQAVKAAERSAPPGQKAEQVLVEAAREVTAAEGRDREALAEAMQEVLSPEQQGVAVDRNKRPRQYLVDAVLHRMRLLDVLDARMFLAINHLPHNRVLNGFFYFITFVFNAGFAWYALMGLGMLLDRKQGLRVVRTSALQLMITSSAVEYPIKSFFRRRRPFITVIKTIVIGKKPGSWSFPSGHSATAFGGAWLLGRHYPRMRPLLYGLASAVAFSRIYLGDHYPGDVVSGSFSGVVIAMVTRRLLDLVGLTRPRAQRRDLPAAQ